MELTAMLLCGALVFIIVTIFFRTMRAADNTPGAAGPEPDSLTAIRAAESLSGMIRIRTVAGAVKSSDPFRRMGDYLRKRYPKVFSTMRVDDIDGNLLLRWIGEEEDADPILFCANTDVVSAEGKWEYGAFTGEIAENMVWGRGAIESKGVLCALLEGAEKLISEGFIPKRDLYISIVRDAETEEAGAHVISELFRKRGIRFSAVFGKGECISLDMLPVSRPQAFVGVADKGHIKVRLIAEDKGGRTGFPPRYTVIGRLSEAICRVEFRPQPIRKSVVLRDMVEGFTPFLPFGKRLLAANMWLFEGRFYKHMRRYAEFYAMLRTTITATEVRAGADENKLPTAAEATVQIRTIPGDSCSDICRFLVNLVDSVGVRVEVDLAEESSPVSPYKGKEYIKLKKALAETFGDLVIAPAIIADNSSVSKYAPYAEAIYRITPFVMTEAEKATIHSANERIGREALGRAVEFYKRLIESTVG